MHMRVANTHIGEHTPEIAALQIVAALECGSDLLNTSGRQVVVIAVRFVKFQRKDTERSYVIRGVRSRVGRTVILEPTREQRFRSRCKQSHAVAAVVRPRAPRFVIAVLQLKCGFSRPERQLALHAQFVAGPGLITVVEPEVAEGADRIKRRKLLLFVHPGRLQKIHRRVFHVQTLVRQLIHVCVICLREHIVLRPIERTADDADFILALFNSHKFTVIAILIAALYGIVAPFGIDVHRVFIALDLLRSVIGLLHKTAGVVIVQQIAVGAVRFVFKPGETAAPLQVDARFVMIVFDIQNVLFRHRLQITGKAGNAEDAALTGNDGFKVNRKQPRCSFPAQIAVKQHGGFLRFCAQQQFFLQGFSAQPIAEHGTNRRRGLISKVDTVEPQGACNGRHRYGESVCHICIC